MERIVRVFAFAVWTGYEAGCAEIRLGASTEIDPITSSCLQQINTVKLLLADTPNSGHLLYSGQCAMYQVLLPFIPYLRNLRLADIF